MSTVRCPDSVLGRLLETRPLRWVGRLSYSLYVWQTLFLQLPARSVPAWFASLMVFPLNYGMILLCAVSGHFLVERPMIQFGRSVARRLRADSRF